MLTVFALTVAAILGWFVVVFRQLVRGRRLNDPGYFAQIGALTVAALNDMNAAMVAATAAMEQFGATMRETGMEAVLSPKQRDIYDELRSIRLDVALDRVERGLRQLS